MVSSERVAHGAVIRKSLRHLKLAADTPPPSRLPILAKKLSIGWPKLSVARDLRSDVRAVAVCLTPLRRLHLLPAVLPAVVAPEHP
jgi:hypothetical protein